MKLHSAEESAALLRLHVKTVRRYIREGRLKATRVGKEYRVSHAELDRFAGQPIATPTPASRTRSVVVSSIVDVDVISADDASRITTLLMAALNMPQHDGPMRADSIYYPEQAKLRVTVTGSIDQTLELIRMIDKLLGRP